MCELMNYYLVNCCEDGDLDHVEFGVSVEDQEAADERIDWLLGVPEGKRILSMEPLLGPVTLKPEWLAGISGVIVGGESGKDARPMHPGWVRTIRDQCIDAGVPFFFKQWGEWAPRDGKRIKLNQKYRFVWWDNDDPKEGWIASSGEQSVRVGKKKAGRFLDGREWNDLPLQAEPLTNHQLSHDPKKRMEI